MSKKIIYFLVLFYCIGNMGFRIPSNREVYEHYKDLTNKSSDTWQKARKFRNHFELCKRILEMRLKMNLPRHITVHGEDLFNTYDLLCRLKKSNSYIENIDAILCTIYPTVEAAKVELPEKIKRLNLTEYIGAERDDCIWEIRKVVNQPSALRRLRDVVEVKVEYCGGIESLYA